MLTITSNINNKNYEFIDKESTLIPREQVGYKKKEKLCSQKKKVLIVTGRIHPGETAGSHMIQGFIKFVASNNPVAIELRSNLILKIIPMLNPDGVILGNYRAGFSGDDLNRQFSDPDSRLHPIVYAIKNLIKKLQGNGWGILGYIDMHGHSKKKCVFTFGPYYPLHSNRYLKVRVLPKLLADRTEMFRYGACKFYQEPAKMSAARLVISREFDVMNCLTLEASCYGFINSERKTIEFCKSYYEQMGNAVAHAIVDYVNLLEEENISRWRRHLEEEKKERK